MPNINLLQNVVPIGCPHCEKLIFISYQFSMPMLNQIFTEEEVKQAKELVLKQVKENANLPESDKIKVEEWLAKPGTLFGPQDVTTVVENITNASHDTLTKP